jgi:hypothetical protein
MLSSENFGFRMKRSTWKQHLCTVNILESHSFLEVSIGQRQEETLNLRLATIGISKKIVSFGLKSTKVIGKKIKDHL